MNVKMEDEGVGWMDGRKKGGMVGSSHLGETGQEGIHQEM